MSIISNSPGSKARSVIQACLAAETNGFNDLLAAALTESGSGLSAFAIDFSAPLTTTFMSGRVSPGDLEETSPMSYPLCSLYVASTVNRNEEKFNRFSGDVQIGLDFWLQDITSKYTGNLEIYADCIEATLIDIFNAQDISDGGVSYAGEISIRRGQILANQDGWVLSVPSTLTLIVNID